MTHQITPVTIRPAERLTLNARTVAAATEVVDERIRQINMWGNHFDDRSPQMWLAILLEEVGELADEIHNDGSVMNAMAEAAQVSAVAMAIVEHYATSTPGYGESLNGLNDLAVGAGSLGDRARLLVEAAVES